MSTQNLIQIKRSETTQTPPSLANGELAWSSNGNVLFIGDFNTVRQVGGEFITGTNEVDVNYAANGQVTIGLANTVNFDDLDISTLTLNTYLVDDIIDDDTMASASNTSLVTSEAIKTYVDAEIGAIVSDFDVAGDSGTDTVFTGQTLTFTGDTGLTLLLVIIRSQSTLMTLQSIPQHMVLRILLVNSLLINKVVSLVSPTLRLITIHYLVMLQMNISITPM